MKLAETPEEQRAWMAQWRSAEKALLEVKREELRALTEEEARAATEELLGSIPFPLPPELERKTSGLVEQQRWFSKAR